MIEQSATGGSSTTNTDAQRRKAAAYRRRFRRTSPPPGQQSAGPASGYLQSQPTRTYVPGYGYVYSNEKGTSGSLRPLNRADTTDAPPDQGVGTWEERGGVYDWVRPFFDSLGEPELGAAVVNVIETSRSGAETIIKIRELPEYAKRLPGNVARQKAGLPPLSEQEYIAQESAYRSYLKYYDLPKGFYDEASDFANWIANDVSPEEIKERASMASTLAINADPNLKQALKQYYGITDGDIAAYFLDSKRTVDVLERQVRASQIGAEAIRSGLDDVGGKKFMEKLADSGIDAGAARGAFQETAASKPTANLLAGIDDVNLSTKDMVKANLDLSPEAAKKVKKLASQERARFSGQSAGTQSLGSQVSGSY